MSNYFTFFPSLLYANTAAVNIIAKVKFDESVSNRLASFYPYTLAEGERADQVADTYYGDPSYDWVVYMSNGIIDPLYEWHKTDNQVNDVLVSKYGSIANTMQQIQFYQVNYEIDDRIITTATYSALPSGQKKYWMPILGYNDEVINYQRKNAGWVVETNQVVQLSGSFGGLQENDIIKQSSSVIGTVGFTNSSSVSIKHVSGTWQTSTPVMYALTNNTANASITSVTVVSEPIPSDELPYWSSVSVFDYETQNNDSLKHIRLLDVRYLDLIERDMRDALS